MKKDVTDLKKLVFDMMQSDSNSAQVHSDNAKIIRKLYNEDEVDLSESPVFDRFNTPPTVQPVRINNDDDILDTEEFVEESLSLEKKEKELIQKALHKHNGKRKNAAQDLGISERTLYRKIKEYNI